MMPLFCLLGLCCLTSVLSGAESDPAASSAPAAKPQAAPSSEARPPTPSPETPKPALSPAAPSPALTEKSGRTGPEKTTFQIEVPTLAPAPPESAAKPPASETRKPPPPAPQEGPATSASAPTPEDPLKKSHEQFESDHRHIQRILQQLVDLREQREREMAQRALAEQPLASIEVRIQKAKEPPDPIRGAVYGAFPGDDAQSVMERANLLFSLGRYPIALQQYHVLKDYPEFQQSLRDTDRAWVLFQIGLCERLNNRPENAQIRWKEVNDYFTRPGDIPPEHLENKFPDFHEDPRGTYHWSTNFWRRQAREEIKNSDDLAKLVAKWKEVTHAANEMRARTRSFIPSYTGKP
jgi:hypothetical protein